jgi:long-subunit acyl-CoA synthetase (AMP-forming)
MLGHRSVLAAVAAMRAFLASLAPYAHSWLGPGDVFLSYLPLAHIYDR